MAQPPRKEAVVHLIAFLSGMCALVYEVVWMRLFIPVFGLSIYSTTTVLVAFMAGLGAGSYLAPGIMRRWRRSFWTLYSILEVGIAIGVIALPFFIGPITSAYVAVSAVDSSGVLVSLVRFAMAVVGMAIPTFFMGLTLPVVVRGCADRYGQDEVHTRRVGILYGANTAGGAVGCLVVGFFLIYQLGVMGTILVTASLNLVLAALVYFTFARADQRNAADPDPETVNIEPARDQVLSRGATLWLYGLIGLVSFGYELCWFRILIFYLHSATYSFSIMLAIFLLGIGLGSVWWSRFLQHRLDPSSQISTVKVLGILQLCIGILGIGTLHLYRVLPDVWVFLVDKMGASTYAIILLQKIVIAGLMLFPPTFLMGITFPLIARLYQSHGVRESTVIGRLYAANTVGAILGCLATGFLLFNWIGVQKSLTLLSVVSIGIGGFFLWRCKGRGTKAVPAGVALVVAYVVLVFMTPQKLLLANFEVFLGDILFYRESAADITLVHQKGQHRTLAFNDGRGTSSTKDSTNYSNRILAYSALAVNPDAKDILVISMGCGNTSSAFTQFPINSLDIVDISSGPFEAAKYFETNLGVLDDPRVQTHVQDGRNWLLTCQKKYDVIEIDLPTVHTEGVVNLYTREFYEVAYSKLNDGGVMLQWIDAAQSRRKISNMMVHTMIDVFDNSLVWASGWQWWVTGVKQDGPVQIDYHRIKERFEDPKIIEDMARVQPRPDQPCTLEWVLSTLVAGGDAVHDTVGHEPLITDNRTYVDYLAPKLKTPTAFGGGLGYYSSPFQKMFRDVWERDGVFTDAEWGMFSFFPENHIENVAASLQSVFVNFPPEILQGIGDRMVKWRDAPAPE